MKNYYLLFIVKIIKGLIYGILFENLHWTLGIRLNPINYNIIIIFL